MNVVHIDAVESGVAAAGGYRGAGVACGIKTSGAADMALVVSETAASAAAVFTTSLAAAAPVTISRANLARSGGRARAVVINSGCANACTGPDGMRHAQAMAELTASALGCPDAEVLVASTGVIGVSLDMARVGRGIADAARQLAPDGGGAAARAIMTTDPFPKEAAVEIAAGAGRYRIGGMAKGSGMIEPRLATMLAVVTTDAAVEPALLQRALASAVADTFNAITVDGEPSTNDCVFLLANGASGVPIGEDGLPAFTEALRAVCEPLAVAIVRGGEGATKVITLRISGAASDTEARIAARAVANSPLVKTAVHGGDPNWGRLIAAAARSGAAFSLNRASVRIGPVELFRDGRPFDERAPEAAEYLRAADVEIEVGMGTGSSGRARMWTCDLSAEYVRINAEYRT